MLPRMSPGTNDLETWFASQEGRLTQKWTHYFDAYDRHFARFRGEKVVLLEIGVAHGGTIDMWKHYFGSGLQYYGIDINPLCASYAEPGVEIFIGSQSDAAFLRDVQAAIPDIDILIDDGGHTMRQQAVTFEVLFEKVKDGGIYLCEDVHTSYQQAFGGGYRRHGTFIEKAKSLVDALHAFHSEQRALSPDRYSRAISSIHFYDSMVFIEKEDRVAPVEAWRGTPSFTLPDDADGLISRAGRGGLRALNRALRTVRIKDITTP